MLLEQYGDIKIALKHNFLAYERSRDEKNVIVSFSYNYFNDAKTSCEQYTIPIEIWENFEYFVSVTDYVTKYDIDGVLHDKEEYNYCLSGIYYQMSIEAFKYRAFVDDISTPSEVAARKEPPFEYSCRDAYENLDDSDYYTEDWDRLMYVTSDKFYK